MAGGFGSAILNILGQPDPRRQLMEANLGGGAVSPLGGDRTGAGAQPAGAMGAAAAPPQPAAYQSPPQLLELYDELLNRSSRERRIDTGIGLMASSFAQPANRSSIMQAATGDYESPSDVFGMITGIQEMQQAQLAKEAAARKLEAQRAALPSIAEQYGLSAEAADLLFNNEQLDDYIMQADKFKAEAAKPENEITELQDGTKVVVNKANGTTVAQIGPAGTGGTTDQQDYNAYVQNEASRGNNSPLSMNDWMLQAKKAGATTINNNPMGGADRTLVESLDKQLTDSFAAAPAIAQTIETVQQARRTLNDPAGVYNGNLTSPAQLELGKVLVSTFGGDASKINNTETFQSQMKELVLPRVKQLGTGNSISNADREFVEKMLGSDITLDPESANRILDIVERGQRRELDKLNAQMKTRIDSAADGSPLKGYKANFRNVPFSPEYVERTTATLDDSDRATLVKEIDNPTFRKEFDKAYGPGSSRDMYEALTGVDPGPLSGSN